MVLINGAERYDFEVIAQWVHTGTRVLDLGCADGELLRFLQQVRQVQGYGVERDTPHVINCIRNGVNVIQNDLEKGLADFEDQQFDHVIMSLSLQAVHNTEGILAEMLRVGREAVVSFPNFGYRKHREAIAAGHMPVSDSLPHQWYNTPNVRFFMISDFEKLCAKNQIVIHERVAFDGDQRISDDPNLNASVAMYRLGR